MLEHINVDGIFLSGKIMCVFVCSCVLVGVKRIRDEWKVFVKTCLDFFLENAIAMLLNFCWNKNDFYWLFVFIVLANKSWILAHFSLCHFYSLALRSTYKIVYRICYSFLFLVGNKLNLLRNEFSSSSDSPFECCLEF